MGCNGNCGSCNGCANELTLAPQEILLLQKLGQIPFLPVARRCDDMIPVYLEDEDCTREEYSLALQLLERKSLISIDYSSPLKGMDMSAYKGLPVHGSFALTERGQSVLEMLEIHGVLE